MLTVWLAGAKNKLMRIVGACKEDHSSTLKPYVYRPGQITLVHHPLHNHIFTFLTGNETNITSVVPEPAVRANQRPRLAPGHEGVTPDSCREFAVAPWLDQANEADYLSLATSLLSQHGIRSGYQLGRLQGSCFYGSTNTATGRTCFQGRHHKSNNFLVEFTRAGDVMYKCYGTACRSEQHCLGQWQARLMDMLNSQQFLPGDKVDATLLNNLHQLAAMNTPKKEKMSQQPFYPRLMEVVCRYMSKFFVFVRDAGMYVLQEFQNDEVFDYKLHTGAQLKDIVRPYKWAFEIWDGSHLRESLATKKKFTANPWDDRTAPDEYNLCQGMMPLLRVPPRDLSPAEVAQIQPLLDHIKNCLAAGSVSDYTNLMCWFAHVVQHPELKIGWCPVSQFTFPNPAAMSKIPGMTDWSAVRFVCISCPLLTPLANLS